MAILNDRIKSRRKFLNKTLLEIAEYIGVKEATMQRYENGKIKSIPYDKIVAIADCLNCSPQYLLGWSDTLYPDDSLTEHEQRVINAYRAHPEMQKAVDTLLHVSDEGSDDDFIAEDIAKTVKAGERLGKLNGCTEKK
ncbi:MAG: helix-turn-helix transcriptional regulator [Lachnospiraceae bacterium]|nr:helix-turn-helix transcriptional regulator [Lachnospiraceae bacterium]